MEKAEFFNSFSKFVDEECLEVEARLGHTISRRIVVRTYGAGQNGVDLSPPEFIEKAYLGGDLFYRIIDLAVIEVRDDATVIFARMSDHAPVELSKTWNGLEGPFKKLKAVTIIEG